jgi:hypothetical protein
MGMFTLIGRSRHDDIAADAMFTFAQEHLRKKFNDGVNSGFTTAGVELRRAPTRNRTWLRLVHRRIRAGSFLLGSPQMHQHELEFEGQRVPRFAEAR